jgi:hypothetical protein
MRVTGVCVFRKVRRSPAPAPAPNPPRGPKGRPGPDFRARTYPGRGSRVKRKSGEQIRRELERTRTGHTTGPGQPTRGGTCCPGWEACLTTTEGARATRESGPARVRSASRRNGGRSSLCRLDILGDPAVVAYVNLLHAYKGTCSPDCSTPRGHGPLGETDATRNLSSVSDPPRKVPDTFPRATP